jgi:hypothetical protein
MTITETRVHSDIHLTAGHRVVGISSNSGRLYGASLYSLANGDMIHLFQSWTGKTEAGARRWAVKVLAGK